ncbi:MAG: hypothetical protein HY558_03805 [Euryarchaeota archaeon]|nr:hypothetical protein [Euryarchaeota archaeon]
MDRRTGTTPAIGAGPIFAQALHATFDALQESRTPYMAIGYVAVSAYGTMRNTLDVDVSLPAGIALRTEAQLDRLLAALQKHQIQIPVKSMFIEALQGGRKRIEATHDPTRVRVDLFFWQLPALDASAFRRRKQRRLFGRHIWIPSAEDEILYKLDAGRRKDVDDVIGMLAGQKGRLDMAYLRRWAAKLGLKGKLEMAVLEVEERYSRLI